jgi:hypothetical protein
MLLLGLGFLELSVLGVSGVFVDVESLLEVDFFISLSY